jgi:hypothetical protein
MQPASDSEILDLVLEQLAGYGELGNVGHFLRMTRAKDEERWARQVEAETREEALRLAERDKDVLACTAGNATAGLWAVGKAEVERRQEIERMHSGPRREPRGSGLQR